MRRRRGYYGRGPVRRRRSGRRTFSRRRAPTGRRRSLVQYGKAGIRL